MTAAPDLAPWLHELTRHREYSALWGLLEELLLNPPPVPPVLGQREQPRAQHPSGRGEQTLDPVLLPCSFPLPGIGGSTRAGVLTCNTSCSINATPGGAPRDVSLCWWGGDGVGTSGAWFLPIAGLMLELPEPLWGCTGEALQQHSQPGKFSPAPETSRRCPAAVFHGAVPILPGEEVLTPVGSPGLMALPMIRDPVWVKIPRSEQNQAKRDLQDQDLQPHIGCG